MSTSMQLREDTNANTTPSVQKHKIWADTIKHFLQCTTVVILSAIVTSSGYKLIVKADSDKYEVELSKSDQVKSAEKV